jgi:tetratricopeptide (TPR) repeat protein/CHAT domain-containing protein
MPSPNPQAWQRIAQLSQQVIQLYEQGQYPHAVSLAARALELARVNLGEDHPDTAVVLTNLKTLSQRYAEQLNRQAVQLYHQGQYAQALDFAAQALELAHTHLGEDHPDTATSLNNLALQYRSLGDHAAALPLYQRALAIREQVLGDTHPDTALSLSNLAGLYTSMGAHAAALPLYQRALAIYEEVLGSDHPDTVVVLTNLKILSQGHVRQLNQQAVQLYEQGQYPQAVSLAAQALELARIHLGENHPDTATSLNNLAELYVSMGDYEAALPLYQQVLAIREEMLGKDTPAPTKVSNSITAMHEEHLSQLNQEVEQLYQQGQYTQALDLATQSLELARTHLGETHPDTARSLNNLAGLYQAMGAYEQARPLYERALAIHEEVSGTTHPDTATSLNNLALLYASIGAYKQAQPLYERALAIYEEVFGATHPNTALSLNNLAVMYKSMGAYEQARSLHERALAIRKQILGSTHPDTAASLDNLAALYRAMGAYEQARPLCEQALAIREQSVGPIHPDTATSLSNLALLYASMGAYEQARPLYERALAICEEVFGATHPNTVTSLDNLAALYQSMGNYGAALPLHQRALAIYEEVLGAMHPDTAGSLGNLAGLYQAMGAYEQARPLHERALAIHEEVSGTTHPDTATSLNNLALLYATTTRPAEALDLMQRAAAIRDNLIGQLFAITSNSQRIAYLKTLTGEFDAFVSLVFQYCRSDAAAVRTALDLVLRRKAIGAEAQAVQHQALLGGKYNVTGDVDLALKLKQLQTVRERLIRKRLSSPGPEGLKAYIALLAEWETDKGRLEADLARKIPEMNLELRLRNADREALAQAMPPGVALVEVVRFNLYDFTAVPARGEQHWQPARYLAFVIPAGEPDNVRMVDLGAAEETDTLVEAFRESLIRSDTGRVGRQQQSAPTQQQSDGRKLRAAVFDPLQDALGGCTRVFLSPDGGLTRLPFEVLPLDDNQLLMDAYRISYLSTGRDVLRFDAQSSGHPTLPIVAADPDFNLMNAEVVDLVKDKDGGAEFIQNPVEELIMTTDNVSLPGVEATKQFPDSVQFAMSTTEGLQPGYENQSASHHARDLGRGTLQFARLPGSRLEGERIAAKLGVEPWLDHTALETRLKSCQSPRILHLATHGHFLSDQEYDLNKTLHTLGLPGWQGGSGSDRFSGPGLENPMLRSMLILAGANTWLKDQPLPPEAEDGLLTAEDVSGLNLLSTDLVVLSACETGLGSVRTGEGVFGLRRAFMLAGAKTLVMSLWKVPDLATAVLMEQFYEKLLPPHKLPRDEALRTAQRYTRDLTVRQLTSDGWLSAETIERLAGGREKITEELQQLAQQPDEHRPFSHPYYWGAFICQGDPRPLPDVST